MSCKVCLCDGDTKSFFLRLLALLTLRHFVSVVLFVSCVSVVSFGLL